MALHVFAASPTDAGLDSDLGNLEAKATLQTGCTLEAFFLCGRSTTIREHDGLLQSLGRWYLSK